MSKKPYRIRGFYDSETNNIASLKDGVFAYPVLHQFGMLECGLREINPGNVEERIAIKLFRHTFEACAELDSIIETQLDYVPVICVHNLGFDMYPLGDWLLSKDVKVLAKSSAKPISFTVLDDGGNPALVLWDTLNLSMQSLSRMGEDCGYPKLDGEWDYNLQRTPKTPLTANEVAYAKHDIYVLACWLSWFLNRNPEIDESRLGLNIVTKTGIVREQRRLLFDGVKGSGCKYNAGRFWHHHNKSQLPKADDELFTMHASTRGGFTFCASNNAGIPFVMEEGYKVVGYDATSQHPAQMVSHVFPVDFHEASIRELELASDIVRLTTLDKLLDDFDKPFQCAFNAEFEFENLRLKRGSIFERDGISCLASARISKNYTRPDEVENEASEKFKEELYSRGYKDTAEKARCSFGKMNSAKSCKLYLTELEFWNVCQMYDFDSCTPIHGYATCRFAKATDYSILSVIHFYTAKNVYKHYLEKYLAGEVIESFSELSKYASDFIVDGMRDGTLSDDDAKQTYLGLKASLNSLFGIEATNEARDDMQLSRLGIVYKGESGIANLPKNPKAWYQFGQRIVGWSRVAQVVHLLLADGIVETVVNGDTDSLKMVVEESRIGELEREFSKYAKAIAKARKRCCSRVARQYGADVASLDGMGDYVREFETDRFCAAWNKAYCIQRMDKRDGKRHFDFTIAGVPASKGSKSLNAFADCMCESGWTFEQICNVLLSYNIIYDSSVTGLNMRKAPEWASNINGVFKDYQGIESLVSEPAAMALYPMQKMIGGTDSKDNATNAKIASGNNPDLNTSAMLATWRDAPRLVELESGKVVFDG